MPRLARILTPVALLAGAVPTSLFLLGSPGQSAASSVAPRVALELAPKPVLPASPLSEVSQAPVADAPTGTLLIPVAGILPSALRDVFTEPRSGGRVHQAIDIMAPRGTPVVSAVDGKLLKLHRSALGGLMVYAADAADRFILMYAHLDGYAPGLVPGAEIKRGQLLGYVGTTGNAPKNAPHLHFAVSRGKPSVKWWKGDPVNPYPLLARGTSLDAAQVAQLEAAPATRATATRTTATRAPARRAAKARRATTTRRTASAERATTRPARARITKRPSTKSSAAKGSSARRTKTVSRSASGTRTAKVKTTAAKRRTVVTRKTAAARAKTASAPVRKRAAAAGSRARRTTRT